jgi:hypothetical protein
MTVEASGVNEPIQMFGQEPPRGLAFCPADGGGREQPFRGPRHDPGAATGLVAAASAGVFRSRLHDLGRLYGPGQLGDRHRWRIEVRLHAAVRHHALQPDGDPASGAGRATRDRYRPRPRAGLSRCLSPRSRRRAVARLRGGDHRLRSGGSRRHRDCPEAIVRHSVDRRRAHHRARCVPATSS